MACLLEVTYLALCFCLPLKAAPVFNRPRCAEAAIPLSGAHTPWIVLYLPFLHIYLLILQLCAVTSNDSTLRRCRSYSGLDLGNPISPSREAVI